ncbi:9208_t:CDS:2, partial [Cetraspora pellucida]
LKTILKFLEVIIAAVLQNKSPTSLSTYIQMSSAEGDVIRKAFLIKVSEDTEVSGLRKSIRDGKKRFAHIDEEDLILWKVNIPTHGKDLGTVIISKNNSEVWSCLHSKMLVFVEPEHFSDKEPINKNIRIIMQLPTTTGKRKLEDSGKESGNRSKKKGKQTYPTESEEGRDSLMVISSKRLKWITKFVENNQISLLRSPPSSGTSTLGQVLRDYFESLDYDSIYISLAGISSTQAIYDEGLFDNFWRNKVGFTWTEISKCKKVIYVFIDEIQIIYGNGAPFFWGRVKDLLSSESNIQNIRIVLLGTYHPTLDPQMTPVDLHTLGLNALLLTWEEVHQLIIIYIQRHATLGSPNFNIPEPVQKAIFNLTGGHPGLCRFILTALRNQFRENGKTVEMLRYLASSYLRDGITATARAFHWIRGWNLTNDESEFIRKKLIFYQTSNPFPADCISYPVTKKFIKLGLFSTIDSNEQIQFSAPIMRVILSQRLFTSPVNFGSLPAKTFDEFLMRTIERMNPSKLSESFGKGYAETYGNLGNNLSWQMEWYRTATTVVPEGTSISADVGAVFGSAGFLNFYVNGELCWGIELIREGDRLKKHAERFEQGGEYANIPLKDWAIIDFRHYTKQIRELKPNFWYVLYMDNYEKVTIKRQGYKDKLLVLQGDNM